MIIQGSVHYDPVHRVSPKKELAIQRTHLVEGLTLLLKTLPYGPKHLARARSILEAYMVAPHLYLPTNHTRVDGKTVKYIYKYFQTVSKQEHAAFSEIKEFLENVENQMCRTKTRPWTAIVKVPPASIKQYREELKARSIVTTPSAWGPHVTWVKGEEPPNDLLWDWYENEEVSLEVTSELIRGSRGYWWVNVECQLLNQYRHELGLNPRPRVPFHITIGKET